MNQAKTRLIKALFEQLKHRDAPKIFKRAFHSVDNMLHAQSLLEGNHASIRPFVDDLRLIAMEKQWHAMLNGKAVRQDAVYCNQLSHLLINHRAACCRGEAKKALQAIWGAIVCFDDFEEWFAKSARELEATYLVLRRTDADTDVQLRALAALVYRKVLNAMQGGEA